MKAITIFSTCTLFGSTFSWAKNLKDNESSQEAMLEALQKQYSSKKLILAELMKEASEQDAQIIALERQLLSNIEAISSDKNDISTNTKTIYANMERISENEDAIQNISYGISLNTDNITSNSNKIAANDSAINQNKNNIDKNTQALNDISNVCIDDYYSATGEYCGKWAGATLRRLPLWGKTDIAVNYQWPTEEMFANMSPDISLKSIEFATVCSTCSYISSAQVTLSDESQSPFFGYDDLQSSHNMEIQVDANGEIIWDFNAYGYDSNDWMEIGYNFETISFDNETPVRTVQVRNKMAEWQDDEYFLNLQFLNQDGGLIYSYNPLNVSNEFITAYDISENEEIIGIYGTLDNFRNRLISFGFVVKTAQ